MRGLGVFMVLILASRVGAAQDSSYPDVQTYFLYKDSSPVTFTWEHDKEQNIDLWALYGSEKCEIYLVNNTDEAIHFDSICNADKYPVKWIHETSQKVYQPGDTIKLKSELTDFYGKVDFPLRICYAKGYQIAYKEIHNGGTLIDSSLVNLSFDRLPLKELEKLKKKNPDCTYFDSGRLKSKRNRDITHDSIPFKVTYYENGTLRMEDFRGINLERRGYDRSGNLSAEFYKDGVQTLYYPNGEIKYTSNQNRYSTTEPFLTQYYLNGCIQKEVFANETIIKEYDPVECGKLIVHETEAELEKQTSNGNVVSQYENGIIIGQTFKHKNGGETQVTGTYEGEKLEKGIARYYAWDGNLLFESKFENGVRDNVLSYGEKQGNQINLIDPQGRKTGLWITVKDMNLTLELAPEFTDGHRDTKNYSFRTYIYERGDTLAEVSFYETGKTRYFSYIKDRKLRIKKGLSVTHSYYENGFMDTKLFILENGWNAVIEYSETDDGLMVGGIKGNTGTLVFNHNILVEIQSVKPREPELDFNSDSYGSKKDKRDYCVAKGHFKNFELYNGFIYYYKANGVRILTEKVTNGVIEFNTRVTLTEPQLIKSALEHDKNHNGWVEQREIKAVRIINLRLSDEELDLFKWTELDKFKKHAVIYTSDRIYPLEKYSSYSKLKQAIKNKEGDPKPRKRDPWDPIIEPPPFPEPIEPPGTGTLVEFPEVEAQFVGGAAELIKWMNDNTKFPEDYSEEVYGKVYISFIIERTGKVSDPEIRRGLNDFCDKEAIRLVNSMPNWIPAENRGKPVRSKYTLPFRFELR